MIAVTYLLFALALAYVLRIPVVYALVGSVLPHLDMLFTFAFPFTPQGILHTPLFAAFVMAVLYLVTARPPVVMAAGVGILSHLFLDTLTALGVMWLYPVTTHHLAFNLFSATDLAVNVIISLYSLLVILGWRYRREVVRWVRV